MNCPLTCSLTPSYSYGDELQNYRIRRNDKGWVTVDEEEYFENLVKLVEVHIHIWCFLSLTLKKVF